MTKSPTKDKMNKNIMVLINYCTISKFMID